MKKRIILENLTTTELYKENSNCNTKDLGCESLDFTCWPDDHYKNVE